MKEAKGRQQSHPEGKAGQLRPTLCGPIDYTVHGILQTRILEWGAFPFSRGSSQPRDWTQVSYIAGGFFTSWATREAHTLAEALFTFTDANAWLKSDLTNILTSEKSQNLQEREVHLKNTEVAHIPSPFPCTPPSSTKLDFLSTPMGREPSVSLAVGGLWSQQETRHLQSPVILQWQVQHPVGLQQTHYYLCDCSALFYLYKDLICSHWKIMFNGEKFVTICCKKKGGYKAIHKIILFL